MKWTFDGMMQFLLLTDENERCSAWVHLKEAVQYILHGRDSHGFHEQLFKEKLMSCSVCKRWLCEQSPSKVCAYRDNSEHCIWCHDPEERK